MRHSKYFGDENLDSERVVCVGQIRFLFLSTNRQLPGRVSVRCFSLILPDCAIGIISTAIQVIVEEQKMLAKV